ncbi:MULTISPECIES: histidine utilization repressor [unclassified Rhizobium]|uniref:histidine utilization repressor n=1 Tax=unclassified Rhizobium TaxID=2613769 RepID=UPI001ADA9D07|nr:MULTISPECIES: histidine utilization repressor [unclassified Rhizobium]MBO9127592.1 histidine utilization repressor [Rhizobium sp. 16-488-2b]MBO9178035.1 histidine utilization repressor [Rhizobium sp. 16-488-2a]
MSALSDSASPLYEKVKDFVLANIGSGKWAQNARLPSENDLVNSLGVSRMTVHRALRELTSEGHLRRVQGVGTFVAPPKAQSTLIEVSNIINEIRDRGGKHRAGVILLERVEHPAAAIVSSFEFDQTKPVDHSLVVHFENDIPVQLEERYVNPALVPHYLDQDFTSIATLEYLQRCTPLTEVEHLISAVPAGPEQARLLQMPERDSCLVLHRKTWTGATVATVNTFTHVGSRYSLGSRYRPTHKPA